MENPIVNPLPENLITSLNVYFYIVDCEKRSLISSIGSICNILGRYPPGALMFPLELTEELHHPKERALMRHCARQFGKRNCQSWSGFYRIRHFNGNWVWIYSKVSFHNGHNGRNQLAAGLVMDIRSSLPQQQNLDSIIREAARFQYAEKIKNSPPRELMIIKLIAEGQCYKDIAGQLFIQPDTVNKHRKNILRKLGLKNIAMLACFAKETGLV